MRSRLGEVDVDDDDDDDSAVTGRQADKCHPEILVLPKPKLGKSEVKTTVVNLY